jgi:hypothetical protein
LRQKYKKIDSILIKIEIYHLFILLDFAMEKSEIIILLYKKRPY